VKTPNEIISDDEIDRVHGHANFGSMSKRDVVNEGVLHCAFGYEGGHTQMMILLEHGLVRRSRGRRFSTSLTNKGKAYLRAAWGQHLHQFRTIARAEVSE
jgi:hypothetical protein